MPHPGHFVPQEDPVPIVREAGWLWGWSGWAQKILPLPGFNPWTDQSIANHYTNSTVPAHSTSIIYLILIPYISMVGNVTVVMFLVHNHLEKFLIFSVIIFVDWIVLGHVTAFSVQAFLSVLIDWLLLCYVINRWQPYAPVLSCVTKDCILFIIHQRISGDQVCNSMD